MRVTEVQRPAAEGVRFEKLLEPILPLAYGVAFRLARNQSDAEDLVQEAALLAYRAYHTYEQGTNFKAWYLRILTNAFFAKYRRRKRQPVTMDIDDAPPLHLLFQMHAAGIADRTDDPAAALLSRLDAEQISDAIAALPEEYRAVCTLYFLDDMAYQEIAEILDCPIGTVRSRLHRGRRMLQKALWQIAQERGIVQGMAAAEEM
jgi:RNA polymerase sigma-70 factor (ECF subfamily)